jgi:Flp pilus assembly protein TadD
MAQGDFSSASEYAELGLACNPRDPEALLAAVALRRLTGASSLDNFIADYQLKHGDNFELHQALGEEAFVADDFVSAVRELAIAGNANLEDLPLRLKLAQAYLGAGQVEESRQLCQRLLPDLPQAIAGLLITNLLNGQDTQADVEIEHEALDREMRIWVELLKKSSQPEIFSQFCQLIPAIEHLFPWLNDLRA